MAYRDRHVVYSDHKWMILVDGQQHAEFEFETQDEAVDYGRQRVKQLQAKLWIHDVQGEVIEELDYGLTGQNKALRGN